MENAKQSIARHILAFSLMLLYVSFQTVKALGLVNFSSAFLFDLRVCFFISLVMLLGVEAFGNALRIWKEYNNPNINKNQ
jgi:hypothetical protein